jgi:carbamoyltransferase
VCDIVAEAIGIEREKVEFESYEGDQDAFVTRVAELIADENVIGWFQGPMEFGPRALGSRSIIGDARSSKMQSVMNLKIKFRESFRPFAPIVLREDAPKYFNIRADQESPYMLVVAPVQESIRKEVDASKEGLEKLSQKRSTVPAVTHVDYSARVQTVDEERNPRLTALLRKFKELTGCPVLINTSFNVRGEPIVCDPANALRCFWGTEMDVLVLEDFVICRRVQKNAPKVDRKEYLSAFALD